MAETTPKEPAGTRGRLIAAAAKLFQEKGYAATGLSEILAAAGAPKGSLYHFFPGGKSDLASAAMAAAGDAMVAELHRCMAQSETAAQAVTAYADQLAQWLEQSGFLRGCPVATVALEEAPGDTPVAHAARDALMATQAALAECLAASGLSATRADELASHTLAALEGALILARINKDSAPVRSAGRQVAAVIEAERAA